MPAAGKTRAGVLAAVVAVAALMGLSLFLKDHAFTGARSGAYTPFYNTESAQYFRYARMVSEGVRIPSLDRETQEPEGLAVFREIPVFGEYLAGGLHRLFFARVPFRLFAEYFDWFFSSLSIIAVFLIARLFAQNAGAAFLAALYYAVSLAAVGRTVNGFFEKEILGLPLILFHLFCFVKYLETRKTGYAVSAAVLAFLLLASWKISQFYYLIFLAWPVLRYLLTPGTDDVRRGFLVFFSLQTAALLLAGILLPHLREQLFIFSPAMICCAAFSAVLLLNRFAELRRWLRAGIFLALSAGLLLLTPKNGDYSSMFDIVLCKVLHLFQKPVDPSVLPLAVRAYWAGPFETPRFGLVLYSLFTYLLWGLAAAALLLKDFAAKKLDPKHEFLLFLNVAFFAAYFLFSRFIILAIVPLAVDAAVILSLALPKSRKALVVAGLLVCVALEGAKTWTFASASPFLSGLLPDRARSARHEEFGARTKSITGMLDWVRGQSNVRGPLLAKYSLSPSVLLYTGRAVVLTPAVFERRSSAAKFSSIFTNLYGPERAFHQACLRYGVNYVVYSPDLFLDNSVYSVRYLAGRTNFDPASAAFGFQFEPESLEGFSLVWQNEYFRIFEVDRGDRPRHAGAPAAGLPYYACYDPAAFRESRLAYPEFLLRWDQAYSLKMIGDGYLGRNQPDQAARFYARSLELLPRMPDALANMARIHLGSRRIDDAEAAFSKSLSIAYSPEAAYGMTLVSFFKGRLAGREQALASILARPPLYPPAVLDLAAIYMKRNDIGAALRLCQKAAATAPDRPEYFELMARIARQAGRPDLEQEALTGLQKARMLKMPKAGGTP